MAINPKHTQYVRYYDLNLTEKQLKWITEQDRILYPQAIIDFAKRYNQQGMSLSYNDICLEIISRRNELLDKEIKKEIRDGEKECVKFDDVTDKYCTSKDYKPISITGIKKTINKDHYYYIKETKEFIYIPLENEAVDYFTVLNRIFSQLSVEIILITSVEKKDKKQAITFVDTISIRFLGRFAITFADLIVLALPNRKYKYDIQVKYDSLDIIRISNSKLDKYQFNRMSNCIKAINKQQLTRNEIENICSHHRLITPLKEEIDAMSRIRTRTKLVRKKK